MTGGDARDDEVVFRGGTILTIDPQHRVVTGDVACVGGAIVQVGGDYTPRSRAAAPTSRSSSSVHDSTNRGA